MPDFHGQTVEVWEDFEDSTLSGWLLSDPGSHASYPASAWSWGGSGSFAINLNFAAGDGAFIGREVATSADLVVGLAVHTPSSFVLGIIARVLTSSWGNCFRIEYTTNGGTPYIGVNLADGFVLANAIAVAVDTPYWLSIRWVPGTGCDLSIYDASHALVGSISGIASNSNVPGMLQIGETWHYSQVASSIYLDDVVYSYSAASYPLLGWSSANNYTLSASSGSFGLSGQAATLAKGYKVQAAGGVLALSGQVAALLRGLRLPALGGAYSISGAVAGLRASRVLVAAAGAIVNAGQPAGLLASRRLGAAAGALILIGQAATLTRDATPIEEIVRGRMYVHMFPSRPAIPIASSAPAARVSAFAPRIVVSVED